MAFTKINYLPGDVLTSEQMNNLQDEVIKNTGNIESHIKSVANPHKVTPDQIGAAKAVHEHNYAGSATAGGAANSANKLETDAGDSNTPVYFKNGVPVKCTSLDLNTSGNAATATKLAKERNIRVNLESTNVATFDGSGEAKPGVEGVLPMRNGGIGSNDGATGLANLLAAGNTILSSYQYGNELPKAGNPGRIFFKKVNG